MASCPLTTTISSENFFRSPSPGDILMLPAPSTPPPAPTAGKSKGGSSSQHNLPGDVDLLVFDILNIFCHCWFLSRANLVTNVISAQKAEDGNISWVEFSPPFHSHLVKCTVVLVPHRACPVPTVKKVMFVFILELLNWEGHLAFFDLQKGGCKANNAQKEKQCLAQKWSCYGRLAVVSDLDDGGVCPECRQGVERICRAITKQVQRSDARIEVDVMHTWNECTE
jgi:hypothetical protein